MLLRPAAEQMAGGPDASRGRVVAGRRRGLHELRILALRPHPFLHPFFDRTILHSIPT